MVRAVESYSDLRLGVLTIFAEAQAWAHGMIDSAMAERAALSARAHNKGRVRTPRALKTDPHSVRNRALYARKKAKE